MNKKSMCLFLIVIFIISFALSFVIIRDSYTPKHVIEPSTFLISKDACIKLNTFREHYAKENTSYVEEIEFQDNLIDIRTEEKFNDHHYYSTINLPIWKVILNPKSYEDLLSNPDTNFFCFYDNLYGDSHDACYRYLRNLLYFLYNRTGIKVNTKFLRRDITDNWEYYELKENLNQNEQYIVFYEELNLGNFTVIDLNEINNIAYLRENINKRKTYNIICTNDFSCLHSWAIKEKLKTEGFDNIKSLIKVINLEMMNHEPI